MLGFLYHYLLVLKDYILELKNSFLLSLFALSSAWHVVVFSFAFGFDKFFTNVRVEIVLESVLQRPSFGRIGRRRHNKRKEEEEEKRREEN